MLEEAMPKIVALQEEQKWSASRLADCKKPKRWDACQDVQGYLQSFPSGKYSEEARRVLKASERTTDALWAAEERRRRQEEQFAEQKRLAEEQAAQRKSGETGDPEGGRATYSRGHASRGGGRSKGGSSVHVREYTKKNGTHVKSHSRSRRK